MQDESDFDLDVEVGQQPIEDEVQDEQQESEVEESQTEATSEGVERKKSGWVDLSAIPEDVRKPIEGRLGELTREKAKEAFKARQLEAELNQLKAKFEKVEPPKEIQMPSYELAIENPEEFNRQNRAYNDSLIAKRQYDDAIKAQEERTVALQQQEQQSLLESYAKRVEALGADPELMREAEYRIGIAGLAPHIGQFLLRHPKGAEIVKELGSNSQELDFLSDIAYKSPIAKEEIISYIAENVVPRLSKVKKPSAPPPPTRVSGSRGTGTKSVNDKFGFTIE